MRFVRCGNRAHRKLDDMRRPRPTLAKLGSSQRPTDRARIPLRGSFAKPPGNRQETAMPKFNRDGVQIYYEVHGSGPPLLLTQRDAHVIEFLPGIKVPALVVVG